MTKKTHILSLLLLVGGGVGCGGSVGDLTGSEDEAIIGGENDKSDPAVMALFGMSDPKSASGFLCTATLVAPTVLVTAAHCVSPSEVGEHATFRVYQDNDFVSNPNQYLVVKETHYDPEFDINNLKAGHDIAVAILAKPLSVKPIAINRQAFTPTTTGASVRIIGYGLSDGVAKTGAGSKRDAQTVIDDFTDTLMHVGNSQKQTCQGDSGGPALMKVNGVEVLVGVTSWGWDGCVNGGFDTRVDLYTKFIDLWVNGVASLTSSSGAPLPPAQAK